MIVGGALAGLVVKPVDALSEDQLGAVQAIYYFAIAGECRSQGFGSQFWQLSCPITPAQA